MTKKPSKTILPIKHSIITNTFKKLNIVAVIEEYNYDKHYVFYV